jgi:hypothetical protein
MIPSTTNESTLIGVAEGSLDAGMSACYSNCQMGWQWSFYQECYVMAIDTACARIVKHPEPLVQCVQVATCEEGYPEKCAKVHTAMCLSCAADTCVAVEKTSWGDMKKLFK